MVKKSTVITQKIGVDIGRGYVKGFTDYENKSKSVIFKAIQGTGKNLDSYPVKKPIDITVNGERLFMGELAQKESYTPLHNTQHSKVTPTAQKLLIGALSELAMTEFVSLNIGVPYQIYTKSTLKEIKDTYCNKTFEIRNNVTNKVKKVTIVNVMIFKEADASIFWTLRKELLDRKNEPIFKKPVGIVNIGFRTTEISYFDVGFEYIDRKSGTIEYGNRDTLLEIQDKIMTDFGINLELPVIDSDETHEYNELKERIYINASEKVAQQIENKWTNVSTNHMTVFVCGGTSQHLTFENGFKVIKEPQLATAKGLYYVACEQL